jgi:hypothetical protein
MRSSFAESVDVIEFQATVAYFNLDLTSVWYSTYKEYREENLKFIERTRPSSFIHSENIKSTWLWKYSLVSKKTPRSLTQLVRVIAVRHGIGLPWVRHNTRFVAWNRKRRRQRQFWVHPIYSERLSLGRFCTSFESYRNYPDKFSSYYRMSVSSFDELQALAGPWNARENTKWRRRLPEAERLSVALR